MKKKFADIIIILVLVLLCVITLYPFLYIISMSISSPDAVLKQSVVWYPVGFSLGSYKMVFESSKIWTAYGNTLFYTFFGTVLSVSLTLSGAYALSRKEFSWSKWAMKAVMLTMIINGGMIPTFLLVSSLGLYNTRLAMILPGAVNTWNFIVARSFFASSIPEELPESARIDGANDVVTFLRIVLPLSLPIVAVMTLFYAVGYWNAWFNALLYLGNAKLHPLQLYLREVLLLSNQDMLAGVDDAFERVAYAMQLKYSVIVVATVPILCVYPFAVKYFVKGVMIGAVKG